MQPNLKEIAEQYGAMVSSISHRMIQNKEIAKEAAQEVWYEIIKSIDSFNEQSELSTWIYTICKRTILRYARNERVATMDELKEFRDLPAMDYNDTDLDEKEWIKTCCDWCLTAQNHCLTNDARLIFIFKINLNLPPQTDWRDHGHDGGEYQTDFFPLHHQDYPLHGWHLPVI